MTLSPLEAHGDCWRGVWRGFLEETRRRNSFREALLGSTPREGLVSDQPRAAAVPRQKGLRQIEGEECYS